MLTSIVRRAPVRALVACALLSLVAACATRPPATALDRLPSHALPANTATPLRDALAAQQAAHPGDSGFHLLANGADALQMRIALARAATRTLDLQYYIAEEDTTGKLLLGAALHAAERGVRVRLLVDDLNFHDAGRVMAALDAHPNIEIRLFNPFGATQQSMFRRTSHFITRIERFSHRMHNKAMIADNQLAIVGGRNLGDEYFSASPTVQFLDLYVLAAGPVTRDISASFDTYWASTSSYPLSYLNRQVFDPADLDAMRDELRAHWHTYADPYNAQPLNATPLAQQIGRGELGLEWAPAEFKVDPPDKVVRATEGNAGPPMRRLVELTRVAQTEFLAFSPYFVPHDAGVEILGQMTGRGVRVAILTNSLAATDAVAVQAGYGPYRVPMLERGIELHEFKARPILRPTLFGSHSRASLHAKSYVIDRKILVIGSMNLDPRSAYLNTELALVIHSPALAQQVAAIFERATQPSESYRVLLATPAERSTVGGDSELIWKGMDGSTPQTFHVDPNAGLLRNVLTGLFMMLPIDDEL